MKWLMNEHEPDLYDARMRDWYIKAAASPKEIVILLDSSGKLERFRTYFLIWVWNWNRQSLERKLDISTIVSKIDHKMWLKNFKLIQDQWLVWEKRLPSTSCWTSWKLWARTTLSPSTSSQRPQPLLSSASRSTAELNLFRYFMMRLSIVWFNLIRNEREKTGLSIT